MSSGRAAVNARFDPLWVKSPLVLMRFPGLLLSLAAGALLLALAASSYPLFISASSSAALDRQIDSVTRFGAGLSIQKESLLVPSVTRYGEVVTPAAAVKEFRARESAFATEVAKVPDLGGVVSTFLAPSVSASPATKGSPETLFRPLFRTGALDRVVPVAGREGSGVWMADLPARRLKIEPGDTIRIRPVGAPGSITVRVDGLYAALFNEPLTPYWRSLSREIYPAGDSGAPPTFLIGDLETVVDISSAVSAESVLQRFEAPLELKDAVTLDDARQIKAMDDRLDVELRDESSPLGKTFCFQCFGGGPDRSSLISVVVSGTERRIAPVEGPVRLLLVAGLLVALAVVAAAGAFAVATRRVEADLLYARGMSPFTLATKTFAEALIPSLIGAGAGVAAAFGLVRLLGPEGPVDENAISDALRVAAISVPVSVVMLGVVAAFSFLRRSEAASEHFGYLARVPWELAILLLSFYFLGRLLSGGALVRNAATGVTRPSVFLLLFPILFIAGFGILASRLFQGALRRARERSEGVSAGSYVAIHRLAGAPRLTLLLFAAAALALGIFVHSQVIVRSLQTTVDAKALLFVGSDVQAGIRPDLHIPDDFNFDRTRVTRFLEAGTVLPSGADVDLLAVDPDTLPSAAHWERDYGAESLEELAVMLTEDRGGALPVVIANGSLPEAATFEYHGTEIPIEVVAETEAFPGIASKRPLVIFDRTDLIRFFEDLGPDPTEDSQATTELWVRGDTRRVTAALAAFEDQPYTILTVDQVKDIPSISAVIDTFGVLNVLGLGAGLLVVVVIMMYLQARQRAGVVSYALSLRMGLTDASNRKALMAELAVLLMGAYLVGTALALLSARFIVGMIDPLAAIPPAPLFTLPVALITFAFATVALVAAAGGATTNARARGTDFAEVMRLAE